MLVGAHSRVTRTSADPRCASAAGRTAVIGVARQVSRARPRPYADVLRPVHDGRGAERIPDYRQPAQVDSALRRGRVGDNCRSSQDEDRRRRPGVQPRRKRRWTGTGAVSLRRVSDDVLKEFGGTPGLPGPPAASHEGRQSTANVHSAPVLKFARRSVRVGTGSTDRSGTCLGGPAQSGPGLGGDIGASADRRSESQVRVAPTGGAMVEGQAVEPMPPRSGVREYGKRCAAERRCAIGRRGRPVASATVVPIWSRSRVADSDPPTGTASQSIVTAYAQRKLPSHEGHRRPHQ